MSLMHSTATRLRFSSFWMLFWVLVCLHQLYFGWFLLRSSFVPYVMDGNETFSVWWHSHNLYTFSFGKSFGLTDESFSFSESAHPFFHTHQGNMPRLFGFLIYALGARTIESQVLVTTVIIGNLTLFFCYASIASLTRPVIAFVFSVFLFSDYLLFAQWHVVTYRVWYGFLFFGTLFAISSARTENRAWPYILLGVLFFLLFYFELVFAAYLSIICGAFALWQLWRNPKRFAIISATEALGGLTALALLFTQLTLALGIDVVVQDFSVTFLARNASGTAGGTSPLQFFQDHNIVFWQNFRDGSSLRTVFGFLRSISTAVFQVWTPALFVVVVIPFVAVIISFFERKTDLSRSKGPSPRGELQAADVASSEDGRLAANILQFFGAIAVFAGIGLIALELLKPGLMFGLPVNSDVSYVRQILMLVLNVSLIAFLGGHILGKITPQIFPSLVSSLLVLLTVIGAALIIFEPLLPPLIARAIAKYEVITSLSLAASMVVSYCIIPSLLPVLRTVVACALISLIIARCPALFEQNYSDIWLAPFQNPIFRMFIRIVALITTCAGAGIAFFGARRSFGQGWKTAIGRSLGLFCIGIASYAVIYTLSPGYVMSGYAERLAPFAIFFLIFIPTVAVTAIVIAGYRLRSWLLHSNYKLRQVAGFIVAPGCLILIVATIFFVWVKVQVYYARLLPPDHVTFAKSFSRPPFAGASFVVNNYAAVVAYYAHNWAATDGSLAKPSIDPLSPREERLVHSNYLWFADWNSNAEYKQPKYFVCMKTPTFNSVLALRNKERFGNRFSFCGDEDVAWKVSPFYDVSVLVDSDPARFWSVVSLGTIRPVVKEVLTSVQYRDSVWNVEGKLVVKSDLDHPVMSRTVDLLVGSEATCRAFSANSKVLQTSESNASFTLPRDFIGNFRLRAKVRALGSESFAKFGGVWISKAVGGAGVSRCPWLLTDGAFPLSGLFDPEAGWAGPEPWGVWTVGPRAALRPLQVPEAATSSDFVLEADVRAFIPGAGKMQSVRVLANGVLVAEWNFSEANWHRTVTAQIPKSIISGSSSLAISFEVAAPASPLSLALSPDSRALGLGLERLTIEEVMP